MTVLLNLCRESPNRFALNGGIPLLMDLIRDSDPIYWKQNDVQLSPPLRMLAQHSSIFSTLLAFKYDTTALSELAQSGLVEVLSEKLERYTNACKDEKRKQSSNHAEPHSTGTSTPSLDNQDEDELTRPCGNSGCKVRCQFKRRYRTTSPSYQAVEMEFDQLSRLRESRSSLQASTALNIFGWNPDQHYRVDDATSVSSSPRSVVSSSPSSSSLLAWSECSSEADLSESSFDVSSEKNSPTYTSDFSSSPVSSDFSSSPASSPSTSLMSPLHPPNFPSSSDFYESSDEFEDQTVRYSPVCAELNAGSEAGGVSFSSNITNPVGPCRKKARLHPVAHRARKSCCETDLKMLWLKLGQVESKDFYENWPEFTEATHRNEQEVAVYLILKLSWLDDTPHQLVSSQTLKAIIEYLVETPRPTFRACQILFRLAR